MKKSLIVFLTLTLTINLIANVPPQQSAKSIFAQQDRQQQRISFEQRQSLEELSLNRIQIILDQNSVPFLLSGNLGMVSGDSQKSVIDRMHNLKSAYRLTERDDFVIQQSTAADKNKADVRLQQTHQGLRVIGGELVAHLERGKIVAVNGHAIPDIRIDSVQPTIHAEASIVVAKDSVTTISVPESNKPDLVVFITEGHSSHLAWSQLITYVDDKEQMQRDLVFVDANSGKLLGRHPQIWTENHRITQERKRLGQLPKVQTEMTQSVVSQLDDDDETASATKYKIEIYDADEGSKLPGKRIWKEGEKTDDLDKASKSAVTNFRKACAFYKNNFDWLSYNDNLNTKVRATVHFKRNYNNAFWDSEGKRFVFGDGDDNWFTYLSKGLDVVVHEFTHAVTSSTADLIYEGESGALNEAFSDIMGESRDTSRDWRIGEDVFTPAVAGDALRYMNNPTKDGWSRDYYPERYRGDADNGGVHFNSGIANLAFYLMVQGGQHPRGKTSISVPPIGIEKAKRIWFDSVTRYMTPRTNFKEARILTAKVATDLYGQNVGISVLRAWDAVGVTSE